MSFSRWTGRLVGLALLFASVPAWAQTPSDPNASYRSALPLYRDDVRQPLAVKSRGAAAFPGGRLLRFSYAGAHKERVPALLWVPSGASKAHPAPCLFALHGLGSRKEALTPLAQTALPLGYAVLAIDEYGQGERPHPNLKGQGMDVALLTKGVQQTVVDVRRGLDYLDTRPDIAHKRIGLVGLSLGAIIGTISAGVDTRLKAAALISGGGDWGLILKSLAASNAKVGGHSMAGMQGTDWGLVGMLLTPEDPLTFAGHIAPRPVLMENGGRDVVIVPAAARELYEAARRPADAHVQFDVFPDAGHIPPPGLVYPKVRAWLAKNL